MKRWIPFLFWSGASPILYGRRFRWKIFMQLLLMRSLTIFGSADIFSIKINLFWRLIDRRIIHKAERLSVKWTDEHGPEAKLRGRLWNLEENLSGEGIILQYFNSWKGVYLFYNPPNNLVRQTHVDCSWTFCGFFRFFVRNCQPAS